MSSPKTPRAGRPKRSNILSPLNSPRMKSTKPNNDAEEKKERRKSRLVQQEMKNSPYRSSPLKKTSKDAPVSAKLSNDQLSALIAATIEGQVKRKINSKNAFDWNLIDYLSEICTTEDQDMPSFSTLANVIDASGEIYASKVDHLLADTIKVRTDLSRTSNGKSKDENQDSDESGKGSKKSHRFQGNTLVKSAASITMAKLDLEFSVDPLFRKTSAAFDQGGARGLLLNHLATQGMSELKFDSSDSVDSVALMAPTKSAPLDMAHLEGLSPIDSDSSELKICPPFATFQFAGWDASTADLAGNPAEDTDVRAKTPAPTLTVNTEEDFEMDDDDVNFDQSFSEAIGEVDDHDDMENISHERQPRRSGTILSAPVAGAISNAVVDNEFGWLQSGVGSKGWHGESDFSALPKMPGQAKKKAAKAKKPKFTIKFDLDQDWSKLLCKSRAATTLAAATVNAVADNILPDDLQCSATSLTKLFLLPNRTGKTLTRRYGDADDDDDNDWSGGDTFGNDAFIPSGADEPDNDFEDDGSPIPLFDDASGDDGEFGVDGVDSINENKAVEGDLKLIDNVRQVQKINIGYAQKPKIMDVKKLKETLWGEIETATKDVAVEAKQDDDSTGVEETAIPQDAHTFNKLVADVPSKVNTKMAENLSVPIMFVCLLYLANDKELRIDGVDSMDNLLIQQKSS